MAFLLRLLLISRMILRQKETLTRKHAILQSCKNLKTVLRNLAEQLRLLLALNNLLLYFLL